MHGGLTQRAACTRPPEEPRDHPGTAPGQVWWSDCRPWNGVRAFRLFAWLGVGSVKAVFSHPTQHYPEVAYPYRVPRKRTLLGGRSPGGMT